MAKNKMYNLYTAAVLLKVNNKIIHLTYYVHKTKIYNIILILLEK